MSIGAETPIEQPKFSVAHAITHNTKKVISAFFSSPTKHLYFFQLTITIIGLFLGKTFPWQYWLILLCLTGANIFLFHVENNYKEITKE